MFTTQKQFSMEKPVQSLAHVLSTSYWLAIEAGNSDRTPNISGVPS